MVSEQARKWCEAQNRYYGTLNEHQKLFVLQRSILDTVLPQHTFDEQYRIVGWEFFQGYAPSLFKLSRAAFGIVRCLWDVAPIETIRKCAPLEDVSYWLKEVVGYEWPKGEITCS